MVSDKKLRAVSVTVPRLEAGDPEVELGQAPPGASWLQVHIP